MAPKHTPSARLLAVIACLVCRFSSFALPLGSHPTQPIVLPPELARNSESKLLIILPEGVNIREYAAIGSRMQRDSSLWISLWLSIGIVASSDPSEDDLLSAIAEAKRAAYASGFSGTDDDIFIAAHGNVGFVLSSVLFGDGGHNPYKGILLWASYIPDTVGSLLNVKSNVLTIGGELDGLIRITRISKEFGKYLTLTSEYGEIILVSRPVVSLPVNHAAYTSSTTFQNDIQSEISKHEEQDLISKASSAFIVGNSGVRGGYLFALEQLKPLVNNSSQFFDGFFKALEVDKGFWCKHSQYMIAKLEEYDLDKFTLEITQYTEQTPFEQSKSSINTTVTPALISLHTYNPITPNPSDSPSAYVAPIETMCKTFGQEFLLLKLNITSSKLEGTCAQVNEAVIQLVLNKYVSSTTKERFQRTGKYVNYLPDLLRTNGPDWLGTPMYFEPNAENKLQYDMASAYLPTSVSSNFAPGVRYCKLFSASQSAEWILVDALRDS